MKLTYIYKMSSRVKKAEFGSMLEREKTCCGIFFLISFLGVLLLVVAIIFVIRFLFDSLTLEQN